MSLFYRNVRSIINVNLIDFLSRAKNKIDLQLARRRVKCLGKCESKLKIKFRYDRYFDNEDVE